MWRGRAFVHCVLCVMLPCAAMNAVTSSHHVLCGVAWRAMIVMDVLMHGCVPVMLRGLGPERMRRWSISHCLAGTDIGDEGAKALAPALMQCRQLQTFYLTSSFACMHQCRCSAFALGVACAFVVSLVLLASVLVMPLWLRQSNYRCLPLLCF